MKKISFLLLLFASPLFAESSVSSTKNTFSFAQLTSTDTAGANLVWQVFNGPENRKTVYLEKVDIGGDSTALITIYSTNVATGFTGSQSRVTAIPMDIGKGTSVSSCTFTSHGTLPTGETIWYGVALASTTVSPISMNNPIAIRPGKAVYIFGEKSTAGRMFVDFYFREEYAP